MDTYHLKFLNDPHLRKVSSFVPNIDKSVQNFAKELLNIMVKEDGGGIAAPQVGVNKRILIVDNCYDTQKFNPITMINPKIIWTSPQMIFDREGCISIPGVYLDIDRPAEAKVEYQDLNGDLQHLHGKGYFARAIFHELDHLEGKLMIDYLSPLKKKMAINKFKKNYKYIVSNNLGAEDTWENIIETAPDVDKL